MNDLYEKIVLILVIELCFEDDFHAPTPAPSLENRESYLQYDSHQEFEYYINMIYYKMYCKEIDYIFQHIYHPK
jgi:hypothetical protein